MKYELFPEGRSELAAHIVVISYEAPVDENSRTFFRKTKWAGLIVDEGQRLKNDKNLLYGALTALKVPFRVLLTGMESMITVADPLLMVTQARPYRTTRRNYSHSFNFLTLISMLLHWMRSTKS